MNLLVAKRLPPLADLTMDIRENESEGIKPRDFDLDDEVSS